MARRPRRSCTPGRRCQAGEERDDPRGGQHGERRLEAGCRQHEATEHGTDDLAEIGDRVEPPELQAALSGQLARHGPGRRPEGRARKDEGDLPGHQHPEAVREDEPDARGDHHEARAQHDEPPADAIGISAADEV